MGGGLLARAAVGLQGEDVGAGAGLEVERRGWGLGSHGGQIGYVKLVMGEEEGEKGRDWDDIWSWWGRESHS